jgi:hypothetical protein
VNPRLERIAVQLQADAALQRWAAERLPGPDAAGARAWFLAIAADLVAGRCAGPAATAHAAGLPMGSAQALAQGWRDAGLLAPVMAVGVDVDPTHETALVPTGRFMALLDEYVEHAERWTAPRLPQRSAQLLCRLPDAPALGARIEQLYDRFHDLGWIHAHHCGGLSFLMALLLRDVARLHGHEARAVSGLLDIAVPGQTFSIGEPTATGPGQAAGHAFCVVDEAAIVDFGLGSARQGPLRSLPWGLAARLQRQGAQLGGLALAPDRQARWRDDWRHPGTDAEFDRCRPVVQRLVDQYAARYGLVPPADSVRGADAA